MNNTSRAETGSSFKSFIPHLKRITEPDPTECLNTYPHNALPKLAQHRSHHNVADADANHSFVNKSGIRCHRYRLSSLVASHPTPINVPHQFAGAARIDPVARLPLAKEAHRRRLHQLHNFHQLSSGDKSHKKQMRTLEEDNATAGGKGDATKVGNIQLNIVREFAEELERDPDVHFAGAYDWYCTGSALATYAENKGGDWLVHVEDAAGMFNRLRISQLATKKSSRLTLTPCNDFDAITDTLNPHGHIYELMLSQPSTDRTDNLLIVRQKHHITIVHLSTHRIIRSAHSTTVPFVSATLDVAAQQLITIDAQRCVRLWSMANTADARASRSARLATGAYTSNDIADLWTCVRCYGPHRLAIADRESLRLFDTQQLDDTAASRPLYTHRFRSYMDRCEQITCLEVWPSRRQRRRHRFHIGTSHRVFVLAVSNDPQVDADDSDPHDRCGDLIVWTHQLQCFPTMLCRLSGNGLPDAAEVLAIGGHMAGEVRLCETQRNAVWDRVDDDSPVVSELQSHTLPYRPPSVWDSYRLVRRSGDCLDARSRVPHQLRASVTGLALWRSGGGGGADEKNASVFLLQQNSAGDVFGQQLRARDEFASVHKATDALRRRLSEWDVELQRLSATTTSDGNDNGTTFYATDLTNFRAMADVLASNICNPLGIGRNEASPGVSTAAPLTAAAVALADGVDAVADADRSERRPVWRKSLSQLRKYADALAPSMLDVWQMPADENEGRNDDDGAAIGNAASAAGARSKAERIAVWLARTSTQSSQPVGAAVGGQQSMEFDPMQAAAGDVTMMSTIREVDTQNGLGEDVPAMELIDDAATAEVRDLELTLVDASTLEQTMRATQGGHTAKKKKKARAFVPGF